MRAVLVHPTGEVIFSQFAACLVIGASVGFDAFQVTRDDVLALSYYKNGVLAVIFLPVLSSREMPGSAVE